MSTEHTFTLPIYGGPGLLLSTRPKIGEVVITCRAAWRSGFGWNPRLVIECEDANGEWSEIDHRHPFADELGRRLDAAGAFDAAGDAPACLMPARAYELQAAE